MKVSLLNILRCPFCGDRLHVEPGPLLDRHDNELRQGVLFSPGPAYEAEFDACKRYLPEQFELTAEQTRQLATGQLDATLVPLACCCALLNLPVRYY